MNIKKRKLTLILGSMGLLAGISAAILSTTLYSNNIANNNNLVANNNKNEAVNEQSTPKIATPGDYLLNDQNAIELENNISSPSAYGINSGPRGFVSVVNNFITYTGFDGKVIATSTVSITLGESELISVEYSDSANSFLCLIYYSSNNYNNNYLRVISFRESDFALVSSLVPSYTIDQRMDLSRTIFINAKNSTRQKSNSYFLIPQYQRLINPTGSYTGSLIFINENGGLTVENKSFSNMSRNEVIVSATVYRYGGGNGGDEGGNDDRNRYYAFLTYNSDTLTFIYKFFDELWDRNYGWGQIQLISNNAFQQNTLAITWQYIVDNTPKFIANTKRSIPYGEINTWNIILSYDKNNSIILQYEQKNTYEDVQDPKTTTFSPTLVNTLYLSKQTSSNQVKYDIHQAKIYDRYLYAYLSYADYGQGGTIVPKIMRLNFKNISQSRLVWNNNYSNQYISLWDVPYQETNFGKPIAFPVGDAANSNIFTFRGSDTNSYWLLDGTKAAFAYSTLANIQNTNNIFTINGVDEILVKDANPELKTYFTKDLLQQSFSQFRKDTTYSVIKKPNMLAENLKGNIPATLTIDQGYNNTSYQIAAATFDIVLTGFDSEAKTWIEQSDVLINLSKYPYQTGTINNNNDVKQYIYDNVIKGAYKNNLSPNDITNIQLNAQPYNNKDGILKIDSITLNRHYDRDGNLISNSPLVFTLKNNAVLEIRGFKKVTSPTSLKSQTITVDGPLATLTTTQILLPSNKNLLSDWLIANKDSLITNLPDESTIIDLSIESATSSNGQIIISFAINGYYDSDALYTYTTQNQIFNNITLTGFIAQDLATVIQQPSKPVDGSLTQIYPSDVNANNLAFKQFLFDNVIVDPPKLLNVNDINGFNGTADNLLGIYTLTSLTLSRVTDSDGNLVIIPQTFDGFNYEIGGFLSTSLATTINPNPTQALPQSLQDILAEKITISNTDFKEYIFKYVLIDKTAQLQMAVIDSILEPAYNNLEGTIKFKLQINNSVDENGHLTNASKTFDEVITIKGFKKVLPTSIVNNPVIAAGNNTILPSDADPTTYTQIIKDNYATVLTNLPDTFSGTNITSVTVKSTNNELGILYVDIAIDFYYNTVDGLETHSPVLEFNNIAIHGWKSYPFLILNNRVDASLYQSDFATQFAGNAIPSIAALSTLLSDQKFLDLVCPDQQGVPNNHFRAEDDIINNLTGEIQFRVVAVGGQFHPNGDLVTLYGFRKTETISSWIKKTSNIKGTATAVDDIENDVKDQLFKATTNVFSPFGNVVARDDIVVSLKSSSSVAVKIVNTTNFIDDSGNIVSSPTDIAFDVNYQVIIENSNDNDWVYILIFSITGVIGTFLLIWLAYVIIKKCRDKWYK